MDLTYKRQNAFKNASPEELKKIFDYNEGYKKYLDNGKTERETVAETIEMAKANGYKEYRLGDKINKGDKLYYNNRGKALFIIKAGNADLAKNGIRIMVAHVDRLVTGTDELLECKTCSAYKTEEWDFEYEEITEADGTKKKVKVEKIPQEYILQVMWYLGITGRKVGNIAVLIGGQKFRKRKIEFDQELFEAMVEAAKEFWQHVQDNTPPAVMAADGDVIEALYPKNSSKMIDLDITDENVKILVEHHETKIKYLQEIKEHIKQLEAEKTEIETYLKYLIQESAGIRTPQYCVTWKLQKGQVAYDKEAMLADGVYEKYASQTSFRRLNISKNKEFEVA